VTPSRLSGTPFEVDDNVCPDSAVKSNTGCL
jgi:hypothetical protein